MKIMWANAVMVIILIKKQSDVSDSEGNIPLSELQNQDLTITEQTSSWAIENKVPSSFYFDKYGTNWYYSNFGPVLKKSSERGTWIELGSKIGILELELNTWVHEMKFLNCRALCESGSEISGKKSQDPPVRVPGVRKRCQESPFQASWDIHRTH